MNLSSVRSIEFIGLPGAGKTTIARKYKANLESEGYRVNSIREFFLKNVCNEFNMSMFGRLQFLAESLSRRRLNRLTTAFRESLFDGFANNHKEYVDLCHGLINGMKINQCDKNKFNFWLLEEGAGWELFQRKKSYNHVVLLNDEGFLHRSFVYFTEVSSLGINSANYINLSPKHECLVYVRASPDLALKRLIRRNDHVIRELRKLYGNNLRQKFISHASFMDDFAEKLKSSVNVIVVGN